MAYDNVADWAASKRAPFDLSFRAMAPRVQSEPKGVVLIISPFNFPVLLILGPLVSTFPKLQFAFRRPLRWSCARVSAKAWGRPS